MIRFMLLWLPVISQLTKVPKLGVLRLSRQHQFLRQVWKKFGNVPKLQITWLPIGTSHQMKQLPTKLCTWKVHLRTNTHLAKNEIKEIENCGFHPSKFPFSYKVVSGVQTLNNRHVIRDERCLRRPLSFIIFISKKISLLRRNGLKRRRKVRHHSTSLNEREHYSAFDLSLLLFHVDYKKGFITRSV